MSVVTEGSHFIIKDLANGQAWVERIDPAQTELKQHNKWSIPTSFLIGLPYGATFQQQDQEWIRVPRLKESTFVDEILTKVLDDPSCDGEARSPPNKRSKCQVEAQTMTEEDITSLKEQGISGVDLISSLASNSKTFSRRTYFGQEKYILRKLKR